MRWLLVACLAVEGPYLCEPAKEPEGMRPRQITYEDGQPAWLAGPFASQTDARVFVGDVCHRGRDGGLSGMGYELLGDEDQATERTNSKGTAIASRYAGLGTASSKGQSTTAVDHSITVMFRCKAATAPAHAVDAGTSEGANDG